MNTQTRLSPDAAYRHYNRILWVAMSLYTVLILVCIYLIKHGTPEPFRYVLAILPTLPLIWVMWSLYLFLTRADELQQRLHLEALSIAAGVTAFLTLTYGFLEDFAGLPHIPAWWTFLVIDVVWGASHCILRSRYK